MNLFPYLQVVLVSSYSAREIENKIRKVIFHEKPILKEYGRNDYTRFDKRKSMFFRGEVNPLRFKLVQQIYYPEYFLPLILGKIETTSKGCIIFIQYRLLLGTSIFLMLAYLLMLTVATFVLIIERNWFNFLLILCFFASSYAVILLNFHQKVKISRYLLEKALSDDSFS